MQEDNTEIIAITRQGETSVAEAPIFDQHVSYLASLPTAIWAFPMGVFAVGLKYHDAITEFIELIYGLVSNIFESIFGKINDNMIMHLHNSNLNLNFSHFWDRPKLCFYISDTISFLTAPITQLFTPITDFVLGPSPSSVVPNKLEIYPLFGPLTTCFFSKMHAPFTIVLNKGPGTSSSETIYTQTIIPDNIINAAGTSTGTARLYPYDNGKLG